jgi:heat shock protein HtpX
MPGVYLIDSPTPNAFATGRSPSKGAVAVTNGLMAMLGRDELAGVIAHELAHIKHRDTLISSVVATVAGAITMVAEMAQWALLFGGLGGSDDEEGQGGLAGLAGSLVLIVVAPIAALLIQMAISRSREYGADDTGAHIVGDPMLLASALAKLDGWSKRIPLDVNPAASHLFIVNPLSGQFVASLFSTHPPIQDRIKRLRQMAGYPD